MFGNETVTFHCAADGERLSYLWHRQDLELPQHAIGNTTDTLVIRGVTEEDSGNYQCSVSNRFGTVSSDHATLIVTGRACMYIRLVKWRRCYKSPDYKFLP